MSNNNGNGRSQSVRQMFARISRRYDLLNRLMTFGQDLRWRRQAVGKLLASNSKRLLDVGAGTGDLSLEIMRRTPGAMVVAVDFTPEMITIGRSRDGASAVHWVLADARHLPFAANAFDGAISAFLIRNLDDVDRALEEQERVLRYAGTIVILEAVAPKNGRRHPILEAYFKGIIPLLGRLVAGDAAAYNYLPASMDAFLSAEELAEHMQRIGYDNVAMMRRMFGTIAIHWGSKANDRLESSNGDA